MIRHAIADRLHRDGILLFAFDAALMVGTTLGYAFALGVVSVVQAAVRPLRDRHRCDGGCGSRSMDDCGHGRRS